MRGLEGLFMSCDMGQLITYSLFAMFLNLMYILTVRKRLGLKSVSISC